MASFLRDVIKVHPLVIEDIFEKRAHPKVEDHGDYLYIVVHGVQTRRASPQASVPSKPTW